MRAVPIGNGRRPAASHEVGHVRGLFDQVRSEGVGLSQGLFKSEEDSTVSMFRNANCSVGYGAREPIVRKAGRLVRLLGIRDLRGLLVGILSQVLRENPGTATSRPRAVDRRLWCSKLRLVAGRWTGGGGARAWSRPGTKAYRRSFKMDPAGFWTWGHLKARRSSKGPWLRSGSCRKWSLVVIGTGRGV
jgi:hypothetical protein